MDLEKKLNEFADYDISFEIKNGFYHISVKYNENWGVLTPENEYIHAEERNGVYHYIGNMSDVTIEEIFNAIDKTVEYNRDLEKKLELFKTYTTELQKLFAEEKYDVLKTLKFQMKKLKSEKKKKINKAEIKEIETEELEKSSDENVEEENKEEIVNEL